MPLDSLINNEKAPAPPASGDGWQVNASVSSQNGSGSPSNEINGTQIMADRTRSQTPHIPHIDLADSSTGSADKQLPAPAKDWTVAIDLVESGLPDRSNPRGAGVDRQLPVLKQLAKETEGKSVNFVVHAERPIDSHNKPCDQGRAAVDATAACVEQALDNKAVTIERYLIHDGKIEILPDKKYKNAADDLSALVKEAGNLAPSKMLGLVVDSHGAGAKGIETNLGPLSLDQTVGAIKTGLQSTGHQKLDLLDYDACDMAEAKVMASSSNVAKDVVASAGLEGLTYTNDAQNIGAAMQALLANSKMTGPELGNNIVELARTGANGKGENNATPTLANFDLTKYDTFIKSLDHFGDALTKTAADAGNLRQLQEDIDRTPMPVTGMAEPRSHDRDLKSFAQIVLADSQAHKFKGDSRPLEAAAKSLIQSFAPLVTDHFGDKQKGYDHLGLLAAHLPGSEIVDSSRVAREVTPLHEMRNQLKLVLDTTPPLSYKPRVLQYIDQKISELPPDLTLRHPDQVHDLKMAQAGVAKAQDLPAYLAALTSMQQVTSQIDRGPMGAQAAQETKRKAADEQLAYLNAPLEQVAPAWDNFVGLMQEQTK